MHGMGRVGGRRMPRGRLGPHVVKSAGERSVSDSGGRRRGALVELGDEEEAVVDGEALHEVHRAGEPDGEGGPARARVPARRSRRSRCRVDPRPLSTKAPTVELMRKYYS